MRLRVEYKEVKYTKEEKRTPQIEDSVRRLWDKFKQTNIHIIGVPEGERKSKQLRSYLKK